MANSISLNNPQAALAVSWTTPTAPSTSDDVGAAGLSPDALMAYCQSRLDSIDDQVKASFTSQQQNASTTTAIDTFMATLKQYDGGDQKDPAVCKKLEASFGGLIMSLKKSDPGCPALPELTTAYNSMVWSGDGGAAYRTAHGQTPDPSDPDFIDLGTYPANESGSQGDGDLSEPELQGYVETLSNATGDLNSDSQLQMIQLESLMSQRQTAVSLTTNLVQSLGDQESKIADNIGH